MVKEVLDKDMRPNGGLHSSEEDALRTLELALVAALSGFRKTSMATCERPSSCVVKEEHGQHCSSKSTLAWTALPQEGASSKSTLALKKAPCVLSWVEGEGSGIGSWQCLHCSRRIAGDHESMALLRVRGLCRGGQPHRGFSFFQ